MPQAEEAIFLRYIDTPCIYKVYIQACRYTFIVSALDVKFGSVTADRYLWSEVTMLEVRTLDVNSDNGLTTATSILRSTTTSLISFSRPITCSITDSKQSLQPQQPLLQSLQPLHLIQQSFQPQQLQTTSVIIAPSMPNSQHYQCIYLNDDHD